MILLNVIYIFSFVICSEFLFNLEIPITVLFDWFCIIHLLRSTFCDTYHTRVNTFLPHQHVCSVHYVILKDLIMYPLLLWMDTRFPTYTH